MSDILNVIPEIAVEPNLNTMAEQLAISSKEAEVEHNCGLAAIYYKIPTKEAEYDILPALVRLQSRGQEGFGLAFVDITGNIVESKKSGLVYEAVQNTYLRDQLHSKEIKASLGQTRYSTSGKEGTLQPFSGEHLILAHNGTLTNPVTLIEKYIPELKDHVGSDSHSLYLILNKLCAEGMSLEEAMEEVLPQVEGAFSLTVYDPKNHALYGRRDPWGFRPLHIATLKDESGYALLSETYAMEGLGLDFREVLPGETVKITDEGVTHLSQDPRSEQTAHCIFEPIYFANPASEIFNGISVAEFRKQTGYWLADQDLKSGYIPEVIVPVRNSGTLIAEGYCERMITGLLERGIYDPDIISKLIPSSALLTNQYVKRVFIQPHNRENDTNLKFSVIKRMVEGKRAVVIDDSIVRSTTNKIVTDMVRKAGATSLDWRIGADQNKDSCYFGIDFPNRKDLIAYDKNVEEVREFLQIDSLIHIPILESVRIAQSLQKTPSNFCTACFTSDYPIAVNVDLMVKKHAGAIKKLD